MNENNKRRNIYLDLFKFFLAFLVITVHTRMFPFTYSNRLGVIMFLMITGFFMYSKDSSKQLIKAKKFITRSLKYMIISIIIYFIYDLILIIIKELPLNDLLNVFADKKTYINFFIFSSHPRYSHLWYVIALFFVSIIHYICVRLKLTSLYKYFIIFILILVFMLFYFVYPKIENFDIMYIRNAYLDGFPSFAIGFILNKIKQDCFFRYRNIYNLILGIGFFLLQIVEGLILPKEYYYSTLLSSIFLILFLTNLECKSEKWEELFYQWIGKNATFYVYVLHIIVRNRLRVLYEFDTPIIYPFIVFIITFLIYEILFLIFKLLKHCIKKQQLCKIECESS